MEGSTLTRKQYRESIMKGAQEHDARVAARKTEDKKQRKQEASVRKRKARKTKVTRGGKLKRHPSRPPVKKRVVSTKKVAMRGHEDGPLGDIIGREGSTLYIQWPGMDRLFSHNAMYMVSVEVKEEDE